MAKITTSLKNIADEPYEKQIIMNIAGYHMISQLKKKEKTWQLIKIYFNFLKRACFCWDLHAS